jgi:hypothetical protein
LHRSLALNH